MPAWIAILVLAFLPFQAQADEADKLDGILNYFQITDHIGIAGQPSADQFPEIARANYTAVINLAMAESSNAVAEEGDIVTSLGMKYIHIPVPWDAPTTSNNSLRSWTNWATNPFLYIALPTIGLPPLCISTWC